MSFCGKCGNKLDPEAKFCGKCGLTITANDDEDNTVLSEEEPENTTTDDTQSIDDTVIIPNIDPETYAPNPTNKSPLSRGCKIAIGVIGAVAIAFGAFWYVGTTITKPSILVEDFNKAISSNDNKKAASLFYCTDSRVKISEKNIEPLLTYFKDNPFALNDAMENLKKDASNLEINKSLAALKDTDSDYLAITTDGKKLLLFPNYKIRVKPIYIEISTKIKDVSFSLDNQVIGKSDSDDFKKEFGPFVPGKHKLKSSYSGKYASLSEENDILPFTSTSEKTLVTVFSNYFNQMKVSSNHPEAEIYINDKDTGAKVSDNQDFAPLAEGTPIYGVINKNGTAIRSETSSVTSWSTEVYLNFKEDEEEKATVQEEQTQQYSNQTQQQEQQKQQSQQDEKLATTQTELTRLIDNYTRDFCSAVNNNNFSYAEPYLYPDSSFYKELKKYVPYTYNREIKENILSHKITSFKISADYNSATINTEETYNVQNKGTSSKKDFACKYTVKYNSSAGRYQIVALDTIAK